jgi:valyl-tRNA synthetase
MSLDKAFDPKAYEQRLAAEWEEAGLFRPAELGEDGRFSLVIPPPNVTGALHIGHALDLALQDIVIRRERMLGRSTVWVPGTDHAGIATQMVVERHLRAQNTSRHELGREKFLEEIWRWKDVYRQRIVDTIRALGGSCDWSRERFTVDEGFSAAVRETFVRLWDEGLIYRGRRLINWCPSCRTALSDLEVDRDEPELGELWSFAYPIESGPVEEIVVATTRPETMLGDTAIAVHPEDERWKRTIGCRVRHPFFPERDVRIIADPILADPETGTGAVKVTPAHDPNDFECGRRHGLDEISILSEDGTVNENGGPFAGLDRFEARARVKAEIDRLGLARGRRDHSYAPGRCQRCRTIVESTISLQWFCRMEPLAAPALDAVRNGHIRFVPESWEKTYFHWLEGIEDWCISRQLWWGHRIPAWYCDDCGEVHVLREDPQSCPACGSLGLQQEEDVLDTWFSSQLWPFAVFGWPERTVDLARFYPTDVLVTGFDIIFFWVARMIMAGLRLTGEVPFRRVLFHGLVRDAQGQKMSKTRGNAIDPLELLEEHGADSVRFTLAALAGPGSDIALSEERLAGYRAFMNKLWNATRFLLMRRPGGSDFERADYSAADLDEIDRYLISSFVATVERVDKACEAYRYDRAAEELYHFLWHTYCDWSIELAKPDFGEAVDQRRAVVRASVLFDVLDGALRLLHPIAPFISEELWQHLPRRDGDPRYLAVARIPRAEELVLPIPVEVGARAAAESVERWLIEPVGAIRAVRTSAGIAPGRRITVRLKARQEGAREALSGFIGRIGALANADVELIEGVPADEPALRHVLEAVEIVIPLAGSVDLEQERARLERELQRVEKDLLACLRKLDNESFVSKAPAAVVEKERARAGSLEDRRTEVRRLLEQLG